MIEKTVEKLMLEQPEYLWKPLAYENREKLVLHVQAKIGRKVSPEAVTRAQRRVWTKLASGPTKSIYSCANR